MLVIKNSLSYQIVNPLGLTSIHLENLNKKTCKSLLMKARNIKELTIGKLDSDIKRLVVDLSKFPNLKYIEFNDNPDKLMIKNLDNRYITIKAFNTPEFRSIKIKSNKSSFINMVVKEEQLDGISHKQAKALAKHNVHLTVYRSVPQPSSGPYTITKFSTLNKPDYLKQPIINIW
jgi:hypothetical protein